MIYQRNKNRPTSPWNVRVKDQDGENFEKGGFKNESEARTFEDNFLRLVEAFRTNRTPDEELMTWVMRLDIGVRQRLIQRKLIDERMMSGMKTIWHHIEDWRVWIVNSGRTEKHADQRTRMVKHVVKNIIVKKNAKIVGSSDPMLAFDIQEDDPMSVFYFDSLNGPDVLEAVQRMKVLKGGIKRQAHPPSKTTKNSHISSVKQFCVWMVKKMERASKIPWGIQALETPKVLKHERMRQPRILTPEEITKVLDSPEPWRDVYLFALLTGCRPSDLRSLKESNFDLEDGIMEITEGKARREDRTPLSKQAMDVVRKRIAETGGGEAKLFPVPQRIAQMIREHSGIDDIVFYDLRKTYGTMMSRGPVRESVLKAMMRHADVKTTSEYYVHVMDDDQKSAADYMGDQVAQILDNDPNDPEVIRRNMQAAKEKRKKLNAEIREYQKRLDEIEQLNNDQESDSKEAES